jgi:hypothetical protein
MSSNEKDNSLMNGIDKIKSLILGGNNDKTKKETNIDDIFNSISNKLNNKIVSTRQDSIKTFLTKTFNQEINKEEFDSFLNTNINVLNDPENKNRIRRYITADEIVDNIPYAESALRVITTEIISPDDITKDSLIISTQGEEDTLTKDSVEYLKNLKESFNIESILYPIVYNTLKYGDQFIEICNYMQENVPISQTILSENTDSKTVSSSPVEIKFKEVILNENKQPQYNTVYKHNIEFELENYHERLVLNEEDTSIRTKRKVKKEKEKEINSNDIQLIIHDAAYVVKIQTKRFKTCLGYLIIPKLDTYTNSVAYPIPSQTSNSNLYNSINNSNYILDGIDELYSKMLELINKYLTKDDATIDKNDTYEILKRITKEVAELKLNKIKLRFVPTEYMEHFSINNNRFFPYGESIFYKTFFSAKLLILQEILATIKRMTDSVDRKVFRVESDLGRNARNLINQLKDTFKKRKISLDSFGSISSISSSVMAHEDIIIPQSKGVPAVTIETLDKANTTGRDMTEELKYFRDIFVSSLGVPPSYIGLEENVSGNNRNLTHQSVMFSKIIVGHQKIFSRNFRSLLYKLYKVIKKQILTSNVKVNFPPPKYIYNEIIAERIRVGKEIIDILTELGYDKEYFIKDLFPFDFDEIKKSKAIDDINKKIEGEDDQDDLNSLQNF